MTFSDPAFPLAGLFYALSDMLTAERPKHPHGWPIGRAWGGKSWNGLARKHQ
jgi:hypothetical protein